MDIDSRKKKGNWYKILFDKIDLAIKKRLFFEAIFIEYMLIDDRIKTLAKFADIPLNTDKGKPKMLGALIGDLKEALKYQNDEWSCLQTSIETITRNQFEVFEKKGFPQKNIYTYTHVPRKLVHYITNENGNLQLNYSDPHSGILSLLNDWIGERNHWMHAAGNENLTLEEYEKKITPLAIDGSTFCNELCDRTKTIRNSLHLND